MRLNKLNLKACLGVISAFAVIMAMVIPAVPVAAATYAITVRPPANGTISPSGTINVNTGANQTFTITPNSGYAVQDIWVNDGTGNAGGAYSVLSSATPGTGGAYNYTFTNIQHKWYFGASFTPYTLQLVGAINVTLTKAQFESMAAQYPATVTDKNGAVWTGISLWRLIALVDDGDPATFNDSIANSYNINIITCDPNTNNGLYSNSSGTFFFAHNDYQLVANTMNGTAVPPIATGSSGWAWAPLRLLGSNTNPPDPNTDPNYFAHNGGGLVEIQLTNVPATYQVSAPISPSGAGIVSGTGYYTAGAQVNLTATPSGGYLFSSWSSSDINISTPTANPLTFTMPANAVGVTANFVPVPSTSLNVSPVTGTILGNVTLTATLTSGGSPVSGKSVSFTMNGTNVGSTTTDGSGVATLPNVTIPSTLNVQTYSSGIGASFAGDSSYGSSTGTASLTVNQGITTITADAVTGTAGDTVTLTANLACGGVPVNDNHNNITFTMNGISVGNAIGTDTNGVGSESVTIPASIPVGTYNYGNNSGVGVNFNGLTKYAPSSGGNTLTVNALTTVITASAGANGSISPSGAVPVNVGANQTFTITPSNDSNYYRVENVTVDGVSVVGLSKVVTATYSFSNVTANHTISATFMPGWDPNDDHACNILDVVKIGLHWQESGVNGWIAEDVNQDGSVNILDVVVVGLHWQATW